MATRTPSPPTRRRNHGKGHSYLIDGEPVVSVSQIKSMLPKDALIEWAARMSADYVVDFWDDLQDMKPSERHKKVLGARWETSRKAAVRGTTVHGFAQRLVHGEEVTPPEELRGYVDAAARFQDDYSLEPILVEEPLFNRRYKFAGTPDIFAKMKRARSSRQFTGLLDYKTGDKGIYPETAIQLGLYGDENNFYIDASGEEVPIPHVDERWGVLLREDGTYSYRKVIMDPAQLFKFCRYLQMIQRFSELAYTEIFSEMIDG